MSSTPFIPSWDEKPLFNNKILPNSMRLLIVGKSGCGKTVLLEQLLLTDHLDYTNLFLFCPRSGDIDYDILIESFNNGLRKENIRAIYEKKDEIKKIKADPLEMIKLVASKIVSKGTIKAQACHDDSKIPLPETFDKKKKNLILFDDCAYGKQTNLELFFIRGRHSNINCIYISQNYFKLPRQSIRANCNCFIFFKLNKKDLMNIYTDHASYDFKKFQDFEDICQKAWSVEHGYIYIDLTQKEREKMYVPNAFGTFKF